MVKGAVKIIEDKLINEPWFCISFYNEARTHDFYFYNKVDMLKILVASQCYFQIRLPLSIGFFSFMILKERFKYFAKK